MSLTGVSNAHWPSPIFWSVSSFPFLISFSVGVNSIVIINWTSSRQRRLQPRTLSWLNFRYNLFYNFLPRRPTDFSRVQLHFGHETLNYFWLFFCQKATTTTIAIFANGEPRKMTMAVSTRKNHKTKIWIRFKLQLRVG